MGSRGITLPSSPEVSSDPLRNDATSGPSSSGSCRKEPLPVAPSSPDPVFGSVGWLGTGGSPNHTWQHLLFCSSLLCPQQSLPFDLTLVSRWFQVWLNLSIPSSRVATMASAFWWASQTVTRLLSTELSFLPFWGTSLLEEWGSSKMGPRHGCWCLFCLLPLVVFKGWQHLLKEHWFSRRRPRESVQLINLQV